MASDISPQVKPTLPTQATDAASSARHPNGIRKHLSSPTEGPSHSKKASFADELNETSKELKSNHLRTPDGDGAVANSEGVGLPAEGASPPMSKSAALKPLRSIATKHASVVAETPALAFLTGQLNKLKPSDIPPLISDNEFLSDALGHGDIQEFLSQPTVIGDLFSAIELPSGLIKESQSLGLDIGLKVAPKEFLKAIGVDPQRVFAEIQMLKDNLQVDGIAPYLQRSAALRGTRAFTETEPVREAVDPRPDLSARAETPVIVDVPQLTPKMNRGEPHGSPSLGKSAVTTMASAAVPTLGDSPRDVRSVDFKELRVPNTSPASASDLDLARALGAQPVTDPNMNLEGFQSKWKISTAHPPVVTESRSTQIPPIMAEVASGASAGEIARPIVEKASYDAFAAMGNTLNHRDGKLIRVSAKNPLPMEGEPQLQKPSGRSVETHASPVEDLLRLSIAPVVRGTRVGEGSRTNMPTTAEPETTLGSVTTTKTAVRPEQPALQPKDGRSFEQVTNGTAPAKLASPPQRPTSDIATQTPAIVNGESAIRLKPTEIPAEELRVGAPLVESDEVKIHRIDRGDRSLANEFQFEQNSASALGPAVRATAKTPQAFQPDASVSQQLNMQQRVEIIQQVMDRATMLIRDGGGVVRMEFGVPDLGQLEMALNVADDRVDLKMLAGSEKVRDVLAGELNRLRENLAVHELRLGDVEVGIQGRDPRGSGSFEQGRSFAEDLGSGASGTAGLLQKSSQVTAKQSPFRHITAPQINRNGGHIEIRV